ncbi:hypothetical protein LY76DRAFT_599083 [Colletotrichum caudatum]|nr:hypothetical protein LY76DRAFT_599083 [Colletotrichum caudatum]
MPMSSHDAGYEVTRTIDIVVLPEPGRLETPYERGPKAPKILWSCCNCGQANITINTDPCPVCSNPRCAYCPLTKIKRPIGRQHLPGMEHH